jgi:hypothetical protein
MAHLGTRSGSSLNAYYEHLFWDKVDRSPDGCWTWMRAKDKDGYGICTGFLADGMRITKAHRASWYMTNGAIPRNGLVLHNCDNPSCVRPSHLRVGTHTDNMREKHAKGHAVTKLSPQQVKQMRWRYAYEEVTFADLAREYGVDPTNVADIIRRVWWKEI